ncbi:hypothetical protein D3C76_1013930 [compost metagenome]
MHPVQPGDAQRAIGRQQRKHALRQAGEDVVAVGQVAQPLAQAEQRAAQALVVAGDALLQAVVGNAQDMVGAGELVEAQLAVAVGQLQPLQPAPPEIAELAHQHGAEQHADDERGRQLVIGRQAVGAQCQQGQHQQRGAAQAADEAVAHADQQRREDHPGERRLDQQRVLGRVPPAHGHGEEGERQRLQPGDAACTGSQDVVPVDR